MSDEHYTHCMGENCERIACVDRRFFNDVIKSLKEKLDWYQSGDIHTCHDRCKKRECVQSREITALESRLSAAEKLLERAEEWIGKNHEMPGYSELLSDLAKYRESGK